MRRRVLLSIAVGVVAVAIGAYFLFFRASDEQAIKDVLARVADAVRIDEDDNPVLRGARIERVFKDAFEDTVSVSIPELTGVQSGRAPLASAATQAGALSKQASVSLDKVVIKMSPTKDSANVDATCTVTQSGGTLGSRSRDERSATFFFAKSSGAWRIRSVTVWSGPPE